MNKNTKNALFNEFIESAQILLVDRSPRTRSRLTKAIIDLGAKRVNIHSVAHFEEAMDIAHKHKPQLVLSDYMIKGGSGFDLFKGIRSELPELSKTILVLITSNMSQTAVAKAAEEDVDAFVLKPYTTNSFNQSIVNASVTKLYPSEYIIKIEEGKELLFKGEFSKAMAVFSLAMKMNKKPALAYFYHGQAKYMMEESEEAIVDYNEGLKYNAIHYKCQIGLYDLFMKEEKFKKAYDVVQNINKYFPANPKRLKEVIRLSIITKNYRDIESYYQNFIDLDDRESDVINYVCSGMYIYGKYLVEQASEPEKAFEVFDKVAISSGSQVKFLKAIIQILCRYQFNDMAYKFLKRFPDGFLQSKEYKLSALLIESKNAPVDHRLKSALETYNEGIRDFEVYSIMIKAMNEKGYDSQVAKYLEEAQGLYPERKIKLKSLNLAKKVA